MEYSDKNEHLNDDPLENTKNADNAPIGSENGHSAANSPEKSKVAPGMSGDDNASVDQSSDDAASSDEPSNDAPSDDTASTDAGKSEPAPDKHKEDKPGSGEPAADAPETSEKSTEKPASGKKSADTPATSEDTSEVPASEGKSTDAPGKSTDAPATSEKSTEKPAPGKKSADAPATADETEKDTSSNDHQEEKINYELLSKSDLVKLLNDLLNNKSFEQLRSAVDEIHEVYQHKVEQEYEEKKEKFIAGGGLEQHFKPVEDPVDKQMEELYEKFRTLKSDFNKQLEEEKEINLKAKEEILEELRLLMEGQEGFDNTFRKFKQLQKRWFDIGIVPKQNVRDLWNSYNFFVDKFNDYVRINKELRVLDLKKNLDLKMKLCEKAEELENETNISNAFKILQKYHAQWREIGPVPREEKDAIWERFKAATSLINKAHQQFQSELKNSLVDNLEKKIVLCEKAEAIVALDMNNHKDWVQKTNELLAIQKEWKTIGYAPKKDNNQIYARFRRACDTFFDRKATYYAKAFEHQKENLEQKLEIVEQAEELSESKDWKSTTDKLIDLQKRWKEIGPIPRKESDKLWKRFRSACDHFFNAKSDFFGGKNESYEDNLKDKQALITEMNAFAPPGSKSELLSALEEFQTRYNEIGFVPAEVKDKIREDFKKAVNDIIDKSDDSEEEKVLLRYRIRISAILHSPRADSKISFERDKLTNKLHQLRNDISVWENNIGFFKQTESSEDTLSEFNEKIEHAHIRISQMEKKLKIIDNLEDSM